MIVNNHHSSHFISSESISVKYRFPLQILRFYPKITYHYYRSVSQELLLKRPSTHQLFHKTIGSNNSFYSNWKQFLVFKRAKLKFKLAVHCSLWDKNIQMWPLNSGCKHIYTYKYVRIYPGNIFILLCPKLSRVSHLLISKYFYT